MVVAATTPRGHSDGDGIQPGRGGFMRSADGKPYVTTVDGSTVKSGPRKGQPKRTAYGSPSGFGKTIENSTNLVKWGERRVVLGLGVNLALIADCNKLATLDVDSDEYKSEADRIILAAKAAAEANLAADRGTHGHAILEDDDEGRNWIERAEAGELLGIPLDAQQRMVAAWRHMLNVNQLKILITEASCVDDAWRLAGTLDNIAELGQDLRFVLESGEIVTVPAGTVLVLDKKTGQRRISAGHIQYWHGYIIQVASYAQSVPYDCAAEIRGVWPWPISQDHGLIAHLDIAAAIDGTKSVEELCTLTYVDIAAGRARGGETVVAAKAWVNDHSMLSVSQILAPVPATGATPPPEAHFPSGGGTHDLASSSGDATPASADATAGAGTLDDVIPGECAHDWHKVGRCLYCRHCNIRFGAPGTVSATPSEAIAAAIAADTKITDAAEPPTPLSEPSHLPETSPTGDGVTAPSATPIGSSPAVVDPATPVTTGTTTIDGRTANADIDGGGATKLDWHNQLTALDGHANEGATLAADDTAIQALQAVYAALDPAQRTWIGETVSEAQKALVEFHLSTTKTVRRFEILRGLVHLAVGGCTKDDVRAVLAHIWGTDLAWSPLNVGQLVGVMGVFEATRFAELCSNLDTAVAHIDETTERLVFTWPDTPTGIPAGLLAMVAPDTTISQQSAA